MKTSGYYQRKGRKSSEIESRLSFLKKRIASEQFQMEVKDDDHHRMLFGKDSASTPDLLCVLKNADNIKGSQWLAVQFREV
jgi:hypothetical protein